MSELLDKMTQQFDQMKAIAEENYKMAEQAIAERDKARDALRECQASINKAIDFLCDDMFASAELTLESAIQTAKSILGDA